MVISILICLTGLLSAFMLVAYTEDPMFKWCILVFYTTLTFLYLSKRG